MSIPSTSLSPKIVSAAHSPKVSYFFFHGIVEPKMQRLKPSLYLLALDFVHSLSKRIDGLKCALIASSTLRTCHISMIF